MAERAAESHKKSVCIGEDTIPEHHVRATTIRVGGTRVGRHVVRSFVPRFG
jgi:hypothetical protein